jgi:hypothetical protein
MASMERAGGKMEGAEEPIFDPPIAISVLGKNLHDVQIYLAVHSGHTPEEKLTEGRQSRNFVFFAVPIWKWLASKRNLYKVNLYRLWSKKLFWTKDFINDLSYKRAWKAKIHEKIKIFMWLI